MFINCLKIYRFYLLANKNTPKYLQLPNVSVFLNLIRNVKKQIIISYIRFRFIFNNNSIKVCLCSAFHNNYLIKVLIKVYSQ